jgi:hypothetical protein
VIVAVLAMLAFGPSGSSSDPRAAARDHFVSHRFGFAARLPADWTRSARRLVPNLLDPREILSVGTFAMPGGGGDCGREPIAAIDRVRAGEALISIQEEALNRRIGAQLPQTPSLASYSSEARLDLRREPRLPGKQLPPSRSLWSSTLPFRAGGREFDALIYFRGPPSPDRVGQVIWILAGLSFQSGSYVRLPGSAAGDELAAHTR